jgi:predicted phage terminase large subunit-like protein
MQNYSPSQAANELLARRKAKSSLHSFIEYIEYGVTPAKHHALIIDRLEAVERGDIRRLMLFLPPGSAKSTYASVLFPPWYLGRNPGNSIIGASHTSELADRFGRRVRNIVGTAEYNNVFDAQLSADSAAAGRWEMTSGSEYYAVGVGGSVTGRRADLGIIDDPVKSREDADSEISRNKVWEWYKADFYTRLKPNASIILIMTRWHEDDLAGRLLEDAKNGGDQWEVLSLSMEADANDPLGREEGEQLWPEWFTQDMLSQAKRDPRNWLALYQQKPRSESGGEFRKPWLQHYKNKPVKGNKYILVDPASEKKKTSDYTSIFVLLLAEDQNYYVIDMVRDRLNLTERADLLFKLHKEHKPLDVGYEKYGMQADIDHMKDRMERENYRFRISEVGGSTPKNDRIRRMIPLFESGRVWLPETLHKTDFQGQVRDLVADFIEQEYAAFPVGKHDDMMDCLSRIHDISADFPKEKKPSSFGGAQIVTGPTGWMN